MVKLPKHTWRDGESLTKIGDILVNGVSYDQTYVFCHVTTPFTASFRWNYKNGQYINTSLSIGYQFQGACDNPLYPCFERNYENGERKTYKFASLSTGYQKSFLALKRVKLAGFENISLKTKISNKSKNQKSSFFAQKRVKLAGFGNISLDV